MFTEHRLGKFAFSVKLYVESFSGSVYVVIVVNGTAFSSCSNNIEITVPQKTVGTSMGANGNIVGVFFLEG